MLELYGTTKQSRGDAASCFSSSNVCCGLETRKSAPAPIPNSEIDAVRSCLAGGNIEPHPFVAAGERVRVRSGPFGYAKRTSAS